MKFRTVICMTGAMAVCALGAALRLGAQNEPASQGPPHYRVIQLATLGGTSSSGNTINNLGLAMGASNQTGDSTFHAAVWDFGFEFDLGTLGGPNSNIGWPVKNHRGVIAGVSEVSHSPDPLGEKFSCPVLLPDNGLSCVGFIWQNGVMSQLPTLGGNNGFATGVNNLGQAVGWAETTVHDATCTGHQVLQFEAVIYGPGKGQIQELPPLSPDPDSAATAINDKGQVVGISGICGDAIGKLSAKHALLWENGQPIDLGNIGGRAFNTPMAINNLGQVAGFADLTGDVTNGVLTNVNFHAFLWTEENGMQDLKTLPGDALSQATGINDRGQIVGVSWGAGFTHPRVFLWQNGVMTDLNSLIPSGSPISLISAGDINDRGEITGQACVISTGCTETPAFLAIPVSDAEDVASLAQTATTAAKVNAPPVAVPEKVRRMLLRPYGLDRP